jgi:hypothetical protein
MNYDELRRKWLESCLEEFNAKLGDARLYYEPPDHDYFPGDLVEFADNGDAYPHGIGGINHVVNAVTSWQDSQWFTEY